MPQVPYQAYPTAKPSGQGTPDLRVSAPGAAFGTNIAEARQGLAGAQREFANVVDRYGATVGRSLGMVADAVGGLGKEVGHTADEMWNRAIALQQLRNETEARDADTRYTIEAGKLHAAFETLEGKNRYDAFPKYQQDLLEAKDRIRAGLSTDQARKMYDSQALGVFSRSVFNGAGSAAAAHKKWASDSLAASNETAINSVHDNPDDDIGFERTVARVKANNLQSASIHGLSQESLDLENQKDISKAVRMRITGMAKNEPFKAQELLDKSKGMLFGDDIRRTEDIVRQAMYNTGARNISAGVLKDLKEQDVAEKSEKTEQEYVQEGRDIAKKQMPNDPLFADAVTNRIIADYRQHNTLVKDQSERDRFTINDALMNNKSGATPTTTEELLADPKVQDAWNRLKPEEQRKVRRQLAQNAKGDVYETEENRDLFFKNLGLASQDPAEFLNVDVASLDMPLKWKDQLRRKQIDIQKRATQDPRIGRAMQTMDPILNDLGIAPGKNRDTYMRFKGEMQLLVEDFIQEHKKGPNQEEVRKMGAALLAKQPEPGVWWGTNQTPLFEHRLPDKVREEVEQNFQDRGLSVPSEEQIRQYYVRDQYKKLMQPKPSKAKEEGGPQVPISK